MLRTVWKILSALLVFFIAGQTSDSTSASQITTRELSGGESYTTSVSLSTGQYLAVRVEQEGIDVIVALRSPNDKLVAEVNRAIGAQGPEFLHGIAESSGPYVLEVRAANREAQAGRFAIQISMPRPAQASDSLLVAAQSALGEGRRLRVSGLKPNLETAVTVFEAAARDFRTASDLVGAADALIEQGRTVHFLGDAKAAMACFEQARAFYSQAGERHGEALAVFRFAGAAAERKLEHYRRACDMAQGIGNQFIAAKALHSIGYQIGRTGSPNEGIASIGIAIKDQQALGYRYDKAESLLSLGWLHNDLGNLQEGLAAYQEATHLHREDGNRRELANALLFASDGWLLLNNAELARDAVAEALEIAQTGGHQLVEILALLKSSDVYLRMGQPLKALQQLKLALPLAEKAAYM